MGKKTVNKNVKQYALLLLFSFLAIIIGNRIACKNARIFDPEVGEVAETYLVKVDSILSVTEEKRDYGGATDVTRSSHPLKHMTAERGSNLI